MPKPAKKVQSRGKEAFSKEIFMKSGRIFYGTPYVLAAALLLTAVFCLPSTPAKAFGEGLSGALNAATTAAVAGYGAQMATTAADDDDD